MRKLSKLTEDQLKIKSPKLVYRSTKLRP